MSKQEVVTVEVLIEAPDEVTLGNLRRYAVASVTNSCRNVRGGAVAIQAKDQDGNFLALNVVGSPSEEMKEIISDLYGEPERGDPQTGS